MSNNKETLSLIHLAKEYHDNNPYNQVCFFNSFCDLLSSHNTPIFHISQAKFFSGNLLVINDVKSLELCISFPNSHNILYFASSLPWTETDQNYKEWENIFLNNKIKIIAKNKHINDLFSICYKTPVCITERVGYETIEQCI